MPVRKFGQCLHLGEKDGKKRKKNPALLLFEDHSNNIFCRSSFPSLESMPLFFFLSSSQRLRGRQEGGGARTDLILALNLVDPPTPQDKLPIGHDSCFSHKHFSLIIHGLIALHVRFGEAGEFWRRGLRYHVTVCARLLGYCMYIWDLIQIPLRIFHRVVCVLQSIRCRD